MPPSIPPKLADFIRAHVHSVLQLELLLLMRERRVDWTQESVAAELRITPQSADLHLTDLELRGLVARGEAPGSYRFSPATSELSGLVDELADCYAGAKYTVINLMFSVPGDSARSLADAFRLRKKSD